MDLTEFNFTDPEGASPKCWSYVKHKNFISWCWTKHTLGRPLPLDPFEITVKRYKGNKGIVGKENCRRVINKWKILELQDLASDVSSPPSIKPLMCLLLTLGSFLWLGSWASPTRIPCGIQPNTLSCSGEAEQGRWCGASWHSLLKYFIEID